MTLDRTKELAAAGCRLPADLDDATAKFEADQQRVNSLEKSFNIEKIGPRQEEIARAQGAYAGARPARLRQVATRRHRDPRPCNRNDSRPHRRKRRTDHRAVRQRRRGRPAGIGRFARRPERPSGRTRHRAGRLRPSRARQKASLRPTPIPTQVRRRDRADFSRSQPAESDGAGEGAGTQSGQLPSPRHERHGQIPRRLRSRKQIGHRRAVRRSCPPQRCATATARK